MKGNECAMPVSLREHAAGIEQQAIWRQVAGEGNNRVLCLFAARFFNSFLLRQMEFHADSFEIGLAGSLAFETTTLRLAMLSEAYDRAHRAAQARWNLGRHLPDDFPSYVIFHESKIPMRVRTAIESGPGQAETDLFRTHPSDDERIQRARQAGRPGAGFIDAPALVLFSDFEMVARQATYFHYTENLGLTLESSNLVPNRSFN